MILSQFLTEIVADAFEAAGYARTYGGVTSSNRPDLCQFQSNGALSAAKAHRKAPLAIAGEVVERLRADSRFASVEAVAPGFINITLTDGFLAGLMGEMLDDERLLIPKMEPKTVVVDFGGANIAKPLHVGHLRSAIIGEALRRLAVFMGHRVIGDAHLGDWGLQMGLVIAQTRSEMPGLPYFDEAFSGPYPAEPPMSLADLSRMYPEASARAKQDAAFAAEAAQATVDLQDKKPGTYALWQHIRNVSLEDLKANYGILGAHFDYWYGESNADAFIPEVMRRLTERGLLRESDGAQVVDVAREEDKEPMPPMIVVKSNGADMYSTTDLGALLQRATDWQPDEVWYAVDNRQALHFKQVFRGAALAGILPEGTCQHIGFGTMNGKDGKPFRTREGGVMRLSDLIETVTANALEKAVESSVEMDEGERQRVARMTGVAALKIGDLVNYRMKDFVFDIGRFLESDGKTGPYLQYTRVRIASVLRRAAESGFASGPILEPASGTERDLMLALTEVADALGRAYAEKAPNVICEAMFKIAGIFNKFYTENRFLTCPDEARRASWLSLLALCEKTLSLLLNLVGVEIPDRM